MSIRCRVSLLATQLHPPLGNTTAPSPLRRSLIPDCSARPAPLDPITVVVATGPRSMSLHTAHVCIHPGPIRGGRDPDGTLQDPAGNALGSAPAGIRWVR